MRRRTFIGSLLAASMTGAAAPSTAARTSAKQHVAVVGAGAFGGWTALNLLRRGARVTLLDAWGPGHSRSSSGGESRVIRHAYESPLYVQLAQRSLDLWREANAAWGRPLFRPTGVLFMSQHGAGEKFLEVAAQHLQAAGVAHELLTRDELAKRYVQINLDGIASGLLEPDGGFLLARRACEAVVDAFISEGGDYRTVHAQPGPLRGGELTHIALSSGGILQADQYVFACGPWLKTLFPQVLGPHLKISRQEIFYFGAPPGERRYTTPSLPIWADFGSTLWYGIPGAENRGFKIADDTRGPALDPTTAQRTATATGLQAARDYVAHRFPGLKDAPLIESRVCQYTNTPDSDFIVDRHPEAGNAWLLGGGSGHGFKHGPALGELVAGQVLGAAPIQPAFGLARFAP